MLPTRQDILARWQVRTPRKGPVSNSSTAVPPRVGLTLRHAGVPFRTGLSPAARTLQPMTLVLGDVRLDLRQFPNLMPQRLRVAAGQLLAATPALGRFERLPPLALVGGTERARQ